MENVQAWEALVAIIAPFLVAVINRPSWSSYTKRLVLLGVASVVTLVGTYLSGNLLPIDLTNLFPKAVFMVGAIQAAYTILSQIPVTRTILVKTEAATSPGTMDEAVAAKETVSQEAVDEYKEIVA